MNVDSKMPEAPHLNLLYSRDRQMLGPTAEFYQEMLAIAQLGGWHPLLPQGGYLSHMTLVDDTDALGIADGLEKGLALLKNRGDEAWAGSFPVSSRYERWDDIIDFFRSGKYQVDDTLQPTRIRPWGPDLDT